MTSGRPSDANVVRVRASETEDTEHITRQLTRAQGLAKLVGTTPAFRAAIDLTATAADADAPALITGETGTGKELTARALHYLGPRAAFPFVAVNCGSLTENLFADELFGHERGAFTDAHKPRRGLIAEADGGTLFLDEVDALTARGQVALLRVLQDHRFRPLGSNVEVAANVRFVGATNSSLLDLMKQGAFREDLYYRLCVFSIALPALRDRGEDILLLARHFLRLHAPEGRRDLVLGLSAESALLAHRWPGNARELENVMIRATRVCRGCEISPLDLGLPVPASASSLPSPGSLSPLGTYKSLKANAVRAFERAYLERLLDESDGNITRAAAVAGKERRDLGRLIKKYQLEPRAFAKRRV